MSTEEMGEKNTWPRPIEVGEAKEISRELGTIVFNPNRLIALHKDLLEKKLPNLNEVLDLTHYKTPTENTAHAALNLQDILNSEWSGNERFVKTVLSHAVGQLTDDLFESLKELDYLEVTAEQRSKYEESLEVFKINSATLNSFISDVRVSRPKLKGVGKFAKEIEILNDWNNALSKLRVQQYPKVDKEGNLRLTEEGQTIERGEQIKIFGQKSAVGKAIDIEDFRDMFRIWQLDVGRGTEQLSGKMSTFKEMVTWANNQDEGTYVRAIRGSFRGVANTAEETELQGWVQFYPDTDKHLNKLIARHWIDRPDEKTRVLEISYIKLHLAETGQVSAGVRQALLLLHGDINERLKTGDNLDAKYLITSYVDPVEDEPSVRVLEACGFEKVGSIKYERKDKRDSDVYVLNLNKLSNKVFRSAFQLDSEPLNNGS